ncbi:serine/threonine protein phosphatase [Nocardia panacis]|uniref:Serine/threonine protein phosphatase n=1 Tax=Nocardia panacis TaxID=2340916 RepID=A0A3A4KB47_9NOCA|nr:serine/threonine protein phosphatase [Nocardia panacis]RJO75275.1 serine/threonine protein phosphatase [Nocardia panacis]
MTAARSDRHRTLSAFLASRSDIQLAELMDAGVSQSVGVGGGAAVVDVAGISVFVKRVPLTDLELTHWGSTANLFDLPMFCQYGIGGPSFSAWRELAANIMVTDGVLAGEAQFFPMLYHWRVLPGRSPIADEHADTEAVVRALGGCPAVRTRLEALAAARCSLVLFCEYIPLSISDWLGANPADKVVTLERQLSRIVTYLDGRLLHMDGHFLNMRSDGERIYLSDFGLATSPHFDLSTAEREFVERHATHDSDYAAMRLVNWVVTDICGIPTPIRGGPVARNEYVLRCAAGHVPDEAPSAVAPILVRCAPAAARMNAFYWKLFGGDLHAEFPVRENE